MVCFFYFKFILLGLSLIEIEEHIKQINAFLGADDQVHVSLVNGPRAIVLSGSHSALHGLNKSLRKIKAMADEDQSRIPFSQRKPVISCRFLPVTLPFHSSVLQDLLLRDIEDKKLSLDHLSLGIPVYDTHTGLFLIHEIHS